MSADLDLEAIFRRSAMTRRTIEDLHRGGYRLLLRGFREQGVGQTIEDAIADLANELRVWIMEHDAEVDQYAHRHQEFEDSDLMALVRRHLTDGTLIQVLRSSCPEPVCSRAASS